jgi:WD40 repeat protein/tetratricopeptide (TPR) repeat protein/tRNA A-37 threonylcarbamoyl transferase component Bud32
MHIICPHCQNPIELVDIVPRQEIACPSCGSSFRLESESTTDWKPGGGRKLGRFELLEAVGHGAFGTVYKARDPELERTVAVKVPRSGNLADREHLDRFLREARSVAQLRHPGIVTVHEVGQYEGVPYLVSDFVAGMTLTDLLSARRPTPREAAKLIAGAAEALDYAHRLGVVHRDVKPSNIMLEADAKTEGTAPTAHRPKVMDFGLAKRDAGEVTMTTDGQILGTPAYMAPEQARGESHGVDGRSDVYSLGVILYQMLTGELPFRGTTRMLLHQVLHDEPRPPRKLNDRIPRDLQTVCLKCLAKEPARRYQTAADLAGDLRCFLNGEPVKARPVGQLERTWRWCRRNPVMAGLSGAVAALLLAVAVVSAISAWQAAESARQSDESAKRERQAAQDAVEAQRQAEGLVGRQYVDNGLRLMEQGDLSGALLWFVAALKHDANDAERTAMHRLRIGMLLPQCPRPDHVWFHGARVNHAIYSPDGRHVATASDDKTARIWDTDTGEAVTEPLVHGGPVQWLQFSRDGRRLLTLSGSPIPPAPMIEWEARVWDAVTGQPLAPPCKHVHLILVGLDLDAHGAGTPSLSPDGRRLLTHTDEDTAQQWDTATGKPVGPPLKHKSNSLRISRAWFSQDGNQVFTLFGRPIFPLVEVLVWNAATGKRVTPPATYKCDRWDVRRVTPDGHHVLTRGAQVWEVDTGRILWSRDTASTIAISPDGRRAALSSSEGVRVVDIVTGNPIGNDKTAAFWEGGPVALSPDGRYVVIAGAENTGVRCWDVASGLPAAAPVPHITWAQQLGFSPDSRHVLSVSADNGVRVWEAPGLPFTLPMWPHEAEVRQTAFRPDGAQVLTVSGQAARAWPVTGRSADRLWVKPPGKLHLAELSPDGSRVLTIGQQADGACKLMLWDTATGQPFTLPWTGVARLTKALFSPGGRWLLTSANKTETDSHPALGRHIWETATGRLIGKLPLAGDEGLNPVFSRDGTRVLLAGAAGTFQVHDLSTGMTASPVLQHPGAKIFQAWMSADGRRVVTWTDSRAEAAAEVWVWDVAAGRRMVPPIRPATKPPNGFSFDDLIVRISPDGRRVLTVPAVSAMQLWDADTGAVLWNSISANRAWFSRDGRRVLAAGNGWVRVLDSETGQPLTTRMQSALEDSEWISRDGQRVVTAAKDGTARIWDANTGEPISPLLRHTWPTVHAVLSEDGRRLLTSSVSEDRVASPTAELRLWDAATGQPLSARLECEVESKWVALDQYSSWNVDRLLIRDGDSLEVRHVREETRSVAELEKLAVVLSGRRINDRGSIMPLEQERYASGWRDVCARYPAEFRRVAPERLAWHRQQAERLERSKQDFASLAPAVLWHAEQILQVEPADLRALEQRGRARAALGELARAREDYDRVIAAGVANAPWYERGVVHVQLGNWKEAARDFARATEVTPVRSNTWYALAVATLRLKDIKGYRDACGRMLNAYPGPDRDFLVSAAKACMLGPAAVPDFEQVLRLLNGPIGAELFSDLHFKAALYYRMGRHKEAVDLLESRLDDPWGISALNYLFLAMANQAQGHHGAAKQAFAKALDRLKEEEPEPTGGSRESHYEEHWQRRMTRELLRIEAVEALRDTAKGNQ